MLCPLFNYRCLLTVLPSDVRLKRREKHAAQQQCSGREYTMQYAPYHVHYQWVINIECEDVRWHKLLAYAKYKHWKKCTCYLVTHDGGSGFVVWAQRPTWYFVCFKISVFFSASHSASFVPPSALVAYFFAAGSVLFLITDAALKFINVGGEWICWAVGALISLQSTKLMIDVVLTLTKM